MKKIKRLLASLLVVTIMVSAAPLEGVISRKNLKNFSGYLSGFFESFNVKTRAIEYKSDIYTYVLDEENNSIIIGVDKSDIETIIIPERIDNHIVVSIEQEAFSGQTNIKTVILPDSVKTIGAYAFYECSSLESIDLGKVEEIGEKAFFGCNLLTTVELPNTLKITEGSNLIHQFNNFGPFADTGITKVVFEDGTTAIPAYCLNGCKNLTKVVIPDTVITIETNAFGNCTGLSEIELPENLETIGSRSFEKCESLKDFVLPENLELIDEEAFSGCTSLKSIIIPDNLKTIGAWAFYECSSLESIDLGKVEEIKEEAFFGCTLLTTVELPNTLKITEGSNLIHQFNNFGPFAGTGITKAVFEDGTTAIPAYCLNGCKNLTKVVIPDTVITIETNAFGDCENLTDVVLEKVEEIGDKAFYNCVKLEEIYLPETLKKLGNTAFVGCDLLNVKIKREDSYASVALIDCEVPFEAEKVGMIDSPERKLDLLRSSYEQLQSQSSNINTISFSIKYNFKDDIKAAVSDCYIKIKIPSTAILNETTIKVNNTSWSDYYVGRDSVLWIEKIPVSGIVNFKINIEDSNYFASYATISYTVNDVEQEELIGVINSANELLTLSAPLETSKQEIKVSGLASPEKEVRLYVNGVYVKNVITSKTGAYSTELQLPVSNDNETFAVEAKINEGERVAKTEVRYSSNAVTIISAKMIYRDKEYDLIANQGKIPVFSWAPDTSYSFIIQVDKRDAVKTMLIVCPGAAGNESLVCEYNEDLDAFVATGFKGIVVNNVNIRCLTDTLLESFNGLEDKFVESASDIMKDSEGVVYTTTENSAKLEFNDNSSFEMQLISDDKISFVFGEGDESESIGFELIEPKYERVEELPESCVVMFKGVSGNMYLDEKNSEAFMIDPNGCVVSAIKIFGDVINEEYGDDIPKAIAGVLETKFPKFFDKILKYDERLKEQVDLWKKPGNSSGMQMGIVDQTVGLLCFTTDFIKYGWAGFKSELDLYDVFGMYLKIGCLVPLVFTVNPVVAASMAVVTLLYEIVTSDDFANLLNTLFDPIIDPAGIVYEAVPSNVIEGATVSALWIPYDSTVSDFWDADYPDMSKARLWDAEEYDQMNPITTPSDGSYAWDVPEGWWIIKAEKAGYETVYSDWMEIPPERFDINLGLVSTLSPEVDYVNVYSDEIEIAFTQYMDISTLNSDNVKVCMNGVYVSGTLLPANEEKTFDGKNSYASVFTFVPDVSVSGTVIVSIVDVKNYCGKAIEKEYSSDFTVVTKIESLSISDKIYAEINSNSKIQISAFPAEASKGKIVRVRLSNNLVADLVNSEIILDEKGQGYIEVKTKLPGDVVLNLEIEGTGIKAESVIVVGAEIASEEDHKHSYSIQIVDPTCTEQGYTTYTCSCGDSYIDDYIPEKGHTEGGWVVTKPATSTQTGIKTKCCSVCGVTLKTEIIPVVEKGRVNSISIDDISINYKASAKMEPDINADAGVKCTVAYSSSNTSVATVDSNGNVTATGTGDATITCTVTDEYGNAVSDTCNVNVSYTWWQWIIVIVLFGWIWY